MRVKRSTILVLAAWLALLPGCGRVTTSVEQRDALLPTEVATQALSWNIETLDVSGMPYGPVAMASGSDGTHHIAFYENVDDVLRYVSGQSASWSDAETVGSAHDTVLDSGSVSMVLGSDDVPRIGYYAPGGALAYATRADGAWPVTADVVSPYATYISLAVDVDGTTHVVFTDSSGLHHAEQTSDGWSVSTVLANPASGNVGSGAVALDGEGHPQVAVMWTEYVFPTLWAKLGYAEAAYDADGRITWSPVTVVAAYASAASAGVTALALDGSDHPHVAYRSGSGHLTYVTHDGSAWGAPELVDAADSYHPSIALDGSGDPHVAYLVRPAGASTETMHYGVRGDNGWSTETVDEAGDAGAPSLAVDAFDRPHIAYILDTGTANTLRYATVADPVAGYVVSNGNDAGEGSLRQMVLDAPAGATITFASDVSVVTLTSGSLELTKDVTIAGPEAGTVTIRGGEGFAYTVVRVPVAGVDVVFRNLTITGGQADGTYAYGGGIRVDWPGAWTLPQTEPPSLRLERCTVSGNTAHVGGGLYVEGNLTIDASTVSGNYAGSMGGGIEYTGTDLDETWTYTAAATIRNSTFSGNIAESGGAALNNYSGEVTLLFTTITGNRATKTSDGGGIYASEDAATRTRLKGSIVVGNTSWWMGELADDISGGGTNLHYESLGYNLIGAGSGRVDFDVQFRMPGDLTGVTDGGLGALADNGGPTLTHALAATSLAIGRVPSAACTDLAGTDLGSDQRGEARPFGTNCDAGAVESTEAITSYALDVTASPPEGGSVSGAGTYAAGTTANLTATPASHWHLVDWRGDAAGTDASVTVAMDGNKWATATFAPDLYLVQTAIDPVGAGSVLRDPAPADGLYPYGATLTLDPVAAEGYAFSYWNTDPDANDDPWTVTVTGATTYTAHFVPLHELTLETLPTDCLGCAIVANPALAAYRDGAIVVLTAVPATGWSFVEWAGVDAANGTTATVTMNADRTVTATFAQSLFTVTSYTVGQGTVEMSPDQDAYSAGTMVTLTAKPDADWRFDHWNDDAAWVGNPTVIEVSGNMDMTAHFVQTVDFVPTWQGEGVVTVDPPTGPYDVGDTVTVTATPAEGWFFQMWTGDLAGAPATTVITLYEGVSVEAVFQPLLGPMVTIELDGDGYVISEPVGIDCHASGASTCVASFPKNTKLTLFGVAADGAAFLRWTGSVTGIEPDLDLRLRENVELTAHFVALNGAVVAIDPTGSFRGNTAIVSGSLICESDSYDLDVSIAQVVPVKKGDPVTISASTTVVGAVCGQPWMATLVADTGRFTRGEAEVTVIVDGETKTRTVELR